MTSPPPPSEAGAGELIVDVLGSGSGRPTAERDTSSLLIGANEGWTLIDCPGSVVHKLARRGLTPERIRRVLLTHDHVDHVYGFPHLLHALAIGGRAETLDVVAPAETLATVDAMVSAHRLARGHYPRLRLLEIPARERVEVATGEGFAIHCSPASHGRPTVSVRVDAAGASVCYSSDTRPSDATARLAQGVELLLHDCGGPHRRAAVFGGDHASAAQAARVATAAGAARLVLMHLSTDDAAGEAECLAEARAVFDGDVSLARDGARWQLGESG